MRYPESLPDTNGGQLFPDGLLKVRVMSQEDTESKNGQFTIAVETRVLEPKQYRNQNFNFRFVIGMTASTAAKFKDAEGNALEEDLEAKQRVTWEVNPSARRYGAYLKACGVPKSSDTQEDAENVTAGKPTILIDLGHHEDDNGRKYNDTNAFYAEADAPDGLGAAEPTQQQQQKPATRAATANGNGRPAAAPVRRSAPKAAEAPADADDWN
jgi:hypothetical protein